MCDLDIQALPVGNARGCVVGRVQVRRKGDGRNVEEVGGGNVGVAYDLLVHHLNV